MSTGPRSPAVMLFKSLATGIPKAVVNVFFAFAIAFLLSDFLGLLYKAMSRTNTATKGSKPDYKY
jgi:hypothetical protein